MRRLLVLAACLVALGLGTGCNQKTTTVAGSTNIVGTGTVKNSSPVPK